MTRLDGTQVQAKTSKGENSTAFSSLCIKTCCSTVFNDRGTFAPAARKNPSQVQVGSEFEHSAQPMNTMKQGTINTKGQGFLIQTIMATVVMGPPALTTSTNDVDV
jgi:hypothetical protein